MFVQQFEMSDPRDKEQNAPTNESSGSWICSQLGARDHYSVPRSLHRKGLLEALITDAWAPPRSASGRLPGRMGKRLRQRYDKALADANVLHWSEASAGFEMRALLARHRNVWDSIIARNKWFQSRATQHLKALGRRADNHSDRVVFAYSYAAREILQSGRELGYTTILGQIDPGPAEERIVAEASLRNGSQSAARTAPDSYWEDWRQECDLCHRIVVNSDWSRRALISEGVPGEKIHVIPVAYDPPDEINRFVRAYPESFSAARPLRVLFLGSLILRKGIFEMLKATHLLRTAPVEFWFVGAPDVHLLDPSDENPRLYWIGPVGRERVHDFYRNADIFILPTHSDGFGLTQLEAAAWGLPVIASSACGEVVRHEVNGLVLPAVTPEAIAEAIEWCLMNAQSLQRMSQFASRTCDEFRSDRLVWQLLVCAKKAFQAQIKSECPI